MVDALAPDIKGPEPGSRVVGAVWPAPGSEDTQLRCLMEQEVGERLPAMAELYFIDRRTSRRCRPTPA